MLAAARKWASGCRSAYGLPKVVMLRRGGVIVLLLLGVTATPVVAQPADSHRFRPGAAGVGDPYFPFDGNGGYDVGHYLLDIAYQPQNDRLSGVATITARATQDLSSFNLDLDGLTVRSITVNGRPAGWTRASDELTVTPRRGLPRGGRFTTVVRYDGIPETIDDPILGRAGFFHTDDGAVIAGAPHVADTWFPVNDHPIDKAAYTFRIRVPAGLEAVANGVLLGQNVRAGWSTWTWEAREPMASYLATAMIGQYQLHDYRRNGIRFWDALDPDLFVPVAQPRTGSRFAVSQLADLSYKRLSRVISVPTGGAELSFWTTRDTEPGWDHLFVEAHTVGEDDWTTLPDRNGHTSTDTGPVCPYWLGLHPFLGHYQTATTVDTCTPVGTTGVWSAASGDSDGYEHWSIDLSSYAGRDVEVSISHASDDTVQRNGVFVDDIAVSTGPGTTSFEDDGDTLDGWRIPGAPAGSEPNPNDWITGTVADTPPSFGVNAEGTFARQAEMIGFLSDSFGPYPFSAAGGIVDDIDGLGFALENQTRPIYDKRIFRTPGSGDGIVVHELAHQWYGDSLTVARWQHVWLNEGFASYAEWLWSEREGLGTAQEIFDFLYAAIPANSPLWTITIGDPGPADLFNFAVYFRGAMTLQQLRVAVGDETFFRILRRWSATKAGSAVSTHEFITLAEQISGRQLDALFATWLFAASKPDPANGSAQLRADPTIAQLAPLAARNLITRMGQQAMLR
jgi:hypothetical protein